MSADPLAIAALTLSVGSFVYTWAKDRAQNRRWDALNLARFAVRDLEFLTWCELTLPEYRSTNFGYADPFVTAWPGAGALSGAARVPVAITAYEIGATPETGIVGITVGEVQKAIIDRGDDPDNYVLMKRYQIQFALENVGSTAARNVIVSIAAANGNEPIGELRQPSGTEYVPGEKFWSVFPFATPLDSPFPRDLQLKVRVEFADVHEKHQSASYSFSYDRAVGTFRRS